MLFSCSFVTQKWSKSKLDLHSPVNWSRTFLKSKTPPRPDLLQWILLPACQTRIKSNHNSRQKSTSLHYYFSHSCFYNKGVICLAGVVKPFSLRSTYKFYIRSEVRSKTSKKISCPNTFNMVTDEGAAMPRGHRATGPLCQGAAMPGGIQVK